MNEADWLATAFEQHRPQLRAVAHRVLGSSGEADDAVQEAWLRLSRSEADRIENLGGWLTTTVGRICLDMLRTRTARREEFADSRPLETTHHADGQVVHESPEDHAVLADSVGLALLVVLDTLTPAERLTFVLHDLFAVPFADIAPILGRSPAAAKMLASRARRRVQASEMAPGEDRARQDSVVRAFLAASRLGHFEELIALLDPDVTLHADSAAAALGAPRQLRGAAAVVRQFSGRARGARPALIDGVPGAVWSAGGRPRVVFTFACRDGKIITIGLVADPEHLSALELTTLPTSP